MEFEIINKKEKIRPRYQFVIDTLSSDGVYYPIKISTLYADLPDLKKVMEDLVLTLNEMQSQYPNGKRGMDSYSGDRYERWFVGTADDFYESVDDAIKFLYEDYEWYCDKYGNHNSLIGFKIYYYDEYKIKHDVKILP